jgi:hypothetical protein
LPAANGAVAIGDFNLDGFPDIAVAQPSSNTIRILLGNGDRTFQPPVDYQPGAAVPEIQVGDLNGDGRPDLVTMAAPLTGDDRRLIVLLGNGDGTFGAPQTSVVNVGFYSPIDQIALEDLNGDGKLDLVLAGGLNTFATVLSGNGDGTFGIPVLYHAKGADQGSTFGLAIVDVNGDGNQDVAINLRRSSSTVDEIQLYAGNGDGTFQTPPDVSFAPTADNRGFVKAEFDGDGRVDFATVDDTITDTVVRIFHGAGLPVLRISTTPTGALVKGQTGSFTITLSNAGLSATSGTVNIAQSFSSGLTLQNMSGIGWACSGTSCSRSDSLAPASSYPSITINFAVSVNAQDREGGSTSVASTVVDNPSLDELFLIADPSCSYSLGSQSAEFVAGGGTGSVAVLATSGCAWTVLSNAPWLEITSQFPGSGNGTVNYSVASNTGRSPRSGTLMIFGQTFTVSEAVSTFNPGVFRSGFFWLEDVDGDQQFNTPPDRAFAFGGVPGDIPISGDWNGSGTTKVGVYRPSNGLFILDYDGDGQFTAADKAYSLGIGTEAGDIPVVGDWNGDGKSKVGLFRQGFFWILDTNGNGTFEQGVDQTFAFGGVPGDVPVVGDWNGDGRSKLGLFRLGFFWILDYNGNGSIDNVNGAGGDKAFAYGGIAGDVPIVGDWNGDGKSKVGVFRSGFFWVLDANGNYLFDGTAPGQDFAFAFGGISGDKPVVGKW